MSGSRMDYLKDLLQDCRQVVEEAGVHEKDAAMVVAALIFSDSINGLRKAYLMHNGFAHQLEQRRAQQN